LPEYLVVTVTAALLGWGGFTWRRAEAAMQSAQDAANQVDRVELKMAENYLTRKEFELSMDRIFSTLERLEKKLDFHLTGRAPKGPGARAFLDTDD
jgi:hypothetical protein